MISRRSKFQYANNCTFIDFNLGRKPIEISVCGFLDRSEAIHLAVEDDGNAFTRGLRLWHSHSPFLLLYIPEECEL